MEKKIFFVGGLPRSGSTLLMNLLAQNPECYCTATSGILDIMVTVRNRWSQLSEFKAAAGEENDAQRENVLKGILKSYFAHVDQPVCFDKSRGWLAHAELAHVALGGEEKLRPKFIVPVRDVPDVLASFEKLYRKNAGTRQILTDAHQLYIPMQSALGRAQILKADDMPVGFAIKGIQDAVTRGWRKDMLFVEYEQLTYKPDHVMKDVYEFLEMEPFSHDYENVRQVTEENDEYHFWGPSLHKIKAKVEPQEPQWKQVYNETVTDSQAWINLVKDRTFWKNL